MESLQTLESQPHSLDNLVDDVVQLVSLPDIYHKLEQAIEDPLMSLDHVATLLGADPDLTLRLMGVANSCLFGFPAKVETLSRAVTLIGTRQLRDIVLVTVVVKALRQLDVELIDMSRFWRHSVSTGVIARAIAAHRREKNIERYYAIGLLHDIGKILFYLKLPEEMMEVNRIVTSGEMTQHMAERELFGFDHAQLGGALLESWDLSESLSEVIASHHNPTSSGEWVDDICLVHVADFIANAVNWDGSGQPVVPELDGAAWDIIDVPDSALPELVSRAHEQYLDAVRLLLE